jgi:hypothetical protein
VYPDWRNEPFLVAAERRPDGYGKPDQRQKRDGTTPMSHRTGRLVIGAELVAAGLAIRRLCVTVYHRVSVVIDNIVDGAEVSGRHGPERWQMRMRVSAIMMRSHVYNEYTVETGIKAATDWVVTMPTKRFYVTSTGASRPFQSKFSSTGSCDSIDLIYYDREEQSPGAIIDFSPTTPETRSLCWEANVLTFTGNGGSTNVSNVLRSTNMQNVALLSTWINGWADLSFPPMARSTRCLRPLVARRSSTSKATIRRPLLRR